MNLSLIYYFFLFLLSFLSGLIPLYGKMKRDGSIHLLLLFSASFLISITCIHLMPDAFDQLGHLSGVLIVFGFFLQQGIQKFTHGLEHGHHHLPLNPDGAHQVIVWPVFIGLVIHAFSEGLPLGISYPDAATLPSLTLAIGMHKIPEVILVVALMVNADFSFRKSLIGLLLFALITPSAALIARILGSYYGWIDLLLTWCIPLMAGIFLQIATTIFFEASNQKHQFKWKDWSVVVAGVGISLLSLIEVF